MRRSKRLSKLPLQVGRKLRHARKDHDKATRFDSSGCGKRSDSSSEEWHSEEIALDSGAEEDNDDERGCGDDEVFSVGVGKPPRGKPKPQVSVPTHYVFTC